MSRRPPRPDWARDPYEAPDAIPPIIPDFYSCFQLVGEDPVYEACARAASKLNSAPEVKQYYLREPNQRFVLPITIRVGKRKPGSKNSKRRG